MADISSIKLPNGSTYNFKDSSAQRTLTAGDNITISEDNVISAVGGGGGATYTAGDGISISSDNVISVDISSEIWTFETGDGDTITRNVHVGSPATASEEWTFILEDGETYITKNVHIS